MISFHQFLNNYRQTPRSRFIRKYKPGLEPLYEELSAFERSQYSSYTQSFNELTQSLENPTNNSKKQQHEFNFSQESKQKENQRQGSNISQFIYGARSSIIYDERLDQFQEMPEVIDEENIDSNKHGLRVTSTFVGTNIERQQSNSYSTHKDLPYKLSHVEGQNEYINSVNVDPKYHKGIDVIIEEEA